MSQQIRVKIFVDRSWQVARDIASGAARYAREHSGVSIELLQPSAGVIADLLEHPGDAIIAGGSAEKIYQAIGDRGVPIFNVTGELSPSTYQVISGFREEAEMVCDYLDSFALDRVGFVGRGESMVSRAHIDALIDEAKSRRWRTVALLHDEHHHLDGTRRLESLQEQLGKVPLPAGLICVDDMLARDVIDAALAMDIAIPQDLVVIGNGNDEVICDHASVPISSIEQGADRRGYLAMKLAVRILEGGPPPEAPIHIAPRLVVERTSSRRLARTPGPIGRALQYIEEHLEYPIGVEDVVRSTNSSRRSLYRDFRKVLGRSIGEEIARSRIQRAKELLMDTDLPMIDIAVRCGFSSHAAFSTAFKRETGSTPSEYQSGYGGEKATETARS